MPIFFKARALCYAAINCESELLSLRVVLDSAKERSLACQRIYIIAQCLCIYREQVIVLSCNIFE